MATVNDRRRLAYGAMRQFWFDAPGGVASVPPHLRDKSAGGWFFGQSLDPTGRYVLDDLHLGTPRAVQPGRCANFDGVDDRIDIGNVANIGIGGFSVSLWVKSNTATTRVMVAKNDTLAATQGRWGFHIASGKAYGFVSYYNGSTADTVVATGGANVNDDVWHHVTMTFDRVDVKVYVDGVIANTASASAIPVAADLTNAVTLQIGAANSATYMIGKMFDVRIYNRALTPEEVASIHATSKPGGRPDVALFPANLVGHWKLDDVNAKFVRDSSGNARNGEWKGFALGSSGYLTGMYTGNDVPFSWANEVGYGLKTSADVVVEGGFPSGQTSWTNSGGQSTFSSGFATVKSTDGSFQEIRSAAFTLRAGRRYRLKYTILANRAGQLASDTMVGNLVSTVGTHTVDATAAPANNAEDVVAFNFKRSGVTDIDITNVSITELDEIPQNSAIPSQDVLGNTLAYKDPVPRNAKLIDSHCGTFDGSDDYGACVDGAQLQFTGNYSTSAWVNLSSLPASATRIVGRHDSATGWMAYVSTAGKVSVFRDGSAVEANYVLPTATWVHVATVAEGTVGTVYINGVAVATGAINATQGVAAEVTRLARHGSGYLPGKLSDVRVYSSALSAADVANLYAGKDIAATPVGHWPIAEGDGTTLYDVSGNGNHATLTGISVASFWGTRQSLNHRNIRRGFRVANATGSGRTFSGSSQYFEGAYNSSYDVANNPAWFAAYVKSSGAEGYRAIFGPQKTNQHTWRVYYHGGVHKYALACVNAASSLVVATTEVVTWASGAWDFVFGYHDPVSDTISIALNGSAFVPLAFSGGLISRSNDMQVGIGEGVSGWIGDMGLLAFGKPASTPASWTAIRDAIYNGGSPLQYADLTATQKTDWGLVSWWDCNEHSRYLYDSHGSNDLLGVGIPYVPALTSLASAADGGTINCPAGQHHNQAETRIDFTGGVPAAPWTDGLTVPDSYDYHEAPAGLKKATQRVGGTESERDFYILLAE